MLFRSEAPLQRLQLQQQRQRVRIGPQALQQHHSIEIVGLIGGASHGRRAEQRRPMQAQRRLRHVSDRFGEDPLRVLRGMQLAARYELTAAPETVALCRTLTQEGIPSERLWDEWKKLLLRGTRPSIGLQWLTECGWIRFYPELAALQSCPQDPEWHPEGDVWIHTLHCLDVFARERTGQADDDLTVGLGVLCHD